MEYKIERRLNMNAVEIIICICFLIFSFATGVMLIYIGISLVVDHEKVCGIALITISFMYLVFLITTFGSALQGKL